MSQSLSIKKITERTNLSAMIVKNILGAIRKGELKQGDRLPSMADLAEKLNVGQSSVREALKKLETMKLVNIKHGKGIFVGKADISSMLKEVGYLLIPEKSDILFLMEARKIFECGTIKLAAQRVSDKEIEELHQLVRTMQSELDDPESFIRDDLAFHVKLVAAANNPILPTFLNSIRNLFLREQESVVKLPGATKRASMYHMKIYKAIKNHDAESSAEIMKEHLADIEQAILQYCNKSSNTF